MPHTPGPWKINDMPLPSRGFIRIGNDICHIPKKGKGKYYSIKQLDEETRANTKLIAQSPKLLEALQDLFEHCSMIHKFWGDNSNSKEAEAAIKAAKRAIKEATE